MADNNTPRLAYLAAMAGEEVTLPPPNTRDLKWMAKYLGQDVETEPVQTPEEAYWEQIVKQGGGASIHVEPLTVTENGSYAGETGTAFSPVYVEVPEPSGSLSITENGTYDVTQKVSAVVNVPTGGNPNYVETIEGTMASPFGEHTVTELMAGIDDNSMSVTLQISLQGHTVVLPGAILGYLRFSLAIEPDNTAGWQNVAEVSYYNNGNIYNALYDERGNITDLKPMASSISTVLTIIHHPLPESGT